MIAGRTNSPELGSVPTTEPIAWGATRNPWDTTRSPGGSSGGAAAAVASGMVPFAHASDGGGSIRIPASCCGLVGLKPSQGRITVGPVRDETGLGVEHCVSRTVRDSAALLDATRGPGIGDTVIAPPPTRPYVDELGADPAGCGSASSITIHRTGRRRRSRRCDAAVGRLLESLGHHVEPAWPTALEDKTFSPKFMALGSTQMGLARRRFEDRLGRPLEDREFEPMNGSRPTSPPTSRRSTTRWHWAEVAQYRRALQSWWHDGWDLLLTPTRRRAAAQARHHRRRPQGPDVGDGGAGQFVAFTPPLNTSGQPAISLPLEWTAEGLPVGVQLVAGDGREDVLLRIASQLEQANPWAHRTPGVEMQ